MMSKPIIELYKWLPRFGNEKTDILIEGYVDYHGEYKKWRSSRVVKRHAVNKLVTETGGGYKLIGPINSELWKELNYPIRYLKIFNNGFPVEWKSILYDIRAHLIELSKSKIVTTKRPTPPAGAPVRRPAARDDVFDSPEEDNGSKTELTPIIPRKKARKPTILDSSASDLEIVEETVRRSPRNHKKKTNVKPKVTKKDEKRKLLYLPNRTQDLEVSYTVSYPKSDDEEKKKDQIPKIQWDPEDKKNFIGFVNCYKPQTDSDWQKLIDLWRWDYKLTIDGYRQYAKKFHCKLLKQINPAEEKRLKEQQEKENKENDENIVDISLLEAKLNAKPGTAKFAILKDKFQTNIVPKQVEAVKEVEKVNESVDDLDKSFLPFLLKPTDYTIPRPRKCAAFPPVFLNLQDDSTLSSINASNVSIVEDNTAKGRERQIKDIHRRKVRIPENKKKITGMRTTSSKFFNPDISIDNILPKRTRNANRSLLPEELEEEEKLFSDLEDDFDDLIDQET